MYKLLLVYLCCSMFAIFEIPVIAENGCYFEDFGGICIFDSFYEHPDAEVYFHCDTEYSVGVKMVNHYVLVSGFLSGGDVGSGTCSYNGHDVQRFFKTYYFAVRNDPKHSRGVKSLFVYSVGLIHCKMGKGGRSRVLPSLYGYVS